MMRLTEAVKQLIIINVLLFIASNIYPGLIRWLALYYPASPHFQPLQLVTHMFMHGGVGHLFFNMFGLYMFGSVLENQWGAKRFLKFYFISGFGAMILYLGVRYLELSGLDPNSMLYIREINIPMLGASGAIYGLLAGYGMMFPNSTIMLLIPPIPMKAKYFVLIFGGLELFLGITQVSSGVAHFAHVGGALIGAILIYYWKKKGKLY